MLDFLIGFEIVPFWTRREKSVKSGPKVEKLGCRCEEVSKCRNHTAWKRSLCIKLQGGKSCWCFYFDAVVPANTKRKLVRNGHKRHTLFHFFALCRFILFCEWRSLENIQDPMESACGRQHNRTFKALDGQICKVLFTSRHRVKSRSSYKMGALLWTGRQSFSWQALQIVLAVCKM